MRRASPALIVLAALGSTIVLVWAARTAMRHHTETAVEARLLAEAAAVAALTEEIPRDGPERSALAERLSRALGLEVRFFPPGEQVPATVREALRRGSALTPRRSHETPAAAAWRVTSGERVLGAVLVSMTEEQWRTAVGGASTRMMLWVFPVVLAALLAVGFFARWSAKDDGPLLVEARLLARRILGEAGGEEAGEKAGESLENELVRAREVLAAELGRMRADRALTRAMLESMREGVLAVGRDERVIFHNPALLRLLGVEKSSLEGLPLLEVSRHAAVGEAYREVLEHHVPAEKKFRVADSGDERHLELRVAVLQDAAGVPMGALGVVFDVTRLEVLESIRQTFIANVSHELRTPLASVKAYTETLLEGELDDPEERDSFLQVVLRHARRMEALVDDLTDLSLIEAGAVNLEPTHVDLGTLVEEGMDTMSPRASDRGVRLHADIPADVVVLGDRMRLEQVLLNIVDNAVKFGPEGSEVVVRAWKGEEGVELVVEDQGPGIPPGDLERIFHRFYRVDKARSRDLGGTGLGLSIVKHLVRMHGGTVRAENRKAGGTRVRLLLPLPDASPLRESIAAEAGRASS